MQQEDEDVFAYNTYVPSSGELMQSWCEGPVPIKKADFNAYRWRLIAEAGGLEHEPVVMCRQAAQPVRRVEREYVKNVHINDVVQNQMMTRRSTPENFYRMMQMVSSMQRDHPGIWYVCALVIRQWQESGATLEFAMMMGRQTSLIN